MSVHRPITRRQALAAVGGLMLPLPRLLAQSPPPAGAPAPPPTAAAPPPADLPPDLANLHPVMEWLARENAPRLSFLDPQWRSLEAWKAAARPVFRDRLAYAPAALPLAAQLVSRENRDGFTLETVRFSATAGYDIPARVLIPNHRPGRLPAVVALHCHSGRYTWGWEKVLSTPGEPAALTEFRNGAYGGPWAEALARRGFLVIAIDAFYFGERRLRVEDLARDSVADEARELLDRARAATPGSPEWHAAVNRVCWYYENLTAKTIFAAGATWPGLLAWDEMRTVDYLVSRSDVDPARIGCAGLSIGGYRSALLAGADPRIKAACVTGWMPEYAPLLRNHLRSHTWMVYIPGLYRSLDAPDLVALHAPGALLVQQCRRDKLYPMSAMQGAIDKLARLYAKAGAPERFRGTFHDVPHSFTPPMQEEAFAWLERWL